MGNGPILALIFGFTIAPSGCSAKLDWTASNQPDHFSVDIDAEGATLGVAFDWEMSSSTLGTAPSTGESGRQG